MCNPAAYPPRIGTLRALRDDDDDPYPDWDALYVDNMQWVYRLLFSKVGNRPDAEDLTTEVFLAALRPLRIEASRPEIRAYLRATAGTVLAGFWRRRLGVEVTTIEEDVPVAEPDAASDAHVRAHRALAALPERHRRILQLRFLHGHSIKEAAHAMGVSVANAKVLQHRALRMAAKGDAR